MVLHQNAEHKTNRKTFLAKMCSKAQKSMINCNLQMIYDYHIGWAKELDCAWPWPLTMVHLNLNVIVVPPVCRLASTYKVSLRPLYVYHYHAFNRLFIHTCKHMHSALSSVMCLLCAKSSVAKFQLEVLPPNTRSSVAQICDPNTKETTFSAHQASIFVQPRVIISCIRDQNWKIGGEVYEGIRQHWW